MYRAGRNELILDDVVSALEEGRSPVLLSERREHVDYFAERLTGVARNLVVFRGGMGVKQRQQVAEKLADIADDEERLLLATGRFIGEGFDDARLDSLFLAMPASWQGTLSQYAGRLHRAHQRKKEVRIYDYLDCGVPMLARMFEKRLRSYRSMGYELRALPEAARGPSSPPGPPPLFCGQDPARYPQILLKTQNFWGGVLGKRNSPRKCPNTPASTYASLCTSRSAKSAAPCKGNTWGSRGFSSKSPYWRAWLLHGGSLSSRASWSLGRPYIRTRSWVACGAWPPLEGFRSKG